MPGSQTVGTASGHLRHRQPVMRLVNVGQTSGVKHLIVGRRRKFHIADGKDAVLRHCNRFSKDILGLKIAVVCEIVVTRKVVDVGGCGA